MSKNKAVLRSCEIPLNRIRFSITSIIIHIYPFCPLWCEDIILFVSRERLETNVKPSDNDQLGYTLVLYFLDTRTVQYEFLIFINYQSWLFYTRIKVISSVYSWQIVNMTFFYADWPFINNVTLEWLVKIVPICLWNFYYSISQHFWWWLPFICDIWNPLKY